MRNICIQRLERSQVATKTIFVGVRKAVSSFEAMRTMIDAPYIAPGMENEIMEALQLVSDGKLNAIQITTTGKRGHVFELVIHAENSE